MRPERFSQKFTFWSLLIFMLLLIAGIVFVINEEDVPQQQGEIKYSFNKNMTNADIAHFYEQYQKSEINLKDCIFEKDSVIRLATKEDTLNLVNAISECYRKNGIRVDYVQIENSK